MSQSNRGNPDQTAQKLQKYLGCPPTWHQPEGLANIISFILLEQTYPITYNHERKAFIVHTKELDADHGKAKFKSRMQDFPYADLREEGATSLLNTLRKDMEEFTPREVSEARKVYALQTRKNNSLPAKLNRLVRTRSLCDTKPNFANSQSNVEKILSCSEK